MNKLCSDSDNNSGIATMFGTAPPAHEAEGGPSPPGHPAGPSSSPSREPEALGVNGLGETITATQAHEAEGRPCPPGWPAGASSPSSREPAALDGLGVTTLSTSLKRKGGTSVESKKEN